MCAVCDVCRVFSIMFHACELYATHRTVVIDDSWSSGIRQEGAGLKANSRKFPSGMDALGRFLRSRGLQLGLYTTGGNYTCAGEQGNGEESRGSGGHQHQDAELWIREWGVTYIKQCLCNTTAEIRREAAFEVLSASLNVRLTELRGVLDAGMYP